MINKLFAFILCAAYFLSLGNIRTYAESNTNTVSEIQSLVDGIIDLKLSENNAENPQQWIDEALTQTAGVSSEWYVFSLSRMGSFDFSAYSSALKKYLSENEIHSAVTRQKYALILLSIGENDDFITKTVDNSIGSQGIMGLVYGLHLLNNGCESKTETTETVIEKILSLSTPDGGWAITGNVGDVDATAMTVQALSPHYNSSEAVQKSIDAALSLLSERQLPDGDFSSYGVPNAESTAQVITALTCLGIDPASDTRFIKNDYTVFDGLKKYRLSDGSFSHTVGGDSNENATVQALYSSISYIRMKNTDGKSSLYLFEKEPELIPSETEITEITTTEESTNQSQKSDSISYKPTTLIVIVGVGIIACVFLIILKKNKKQNFAVLAVVVLAAVIFVLLTDFQSADEYYNTSVVKENPIGTVTLSIRCDTITGKSDKEYIPENGEIICDEFEIEAGETVFDILVEAAKKHSIQLDYSGAGEVVYVSGINYIYEFDFGDLSGWIYHVNGESPSVGCDSFTLSDGDNIEWLYSCEMGNDL